MSEALFEARNVSRQFTSGKRTLKAVDGVSFSVRPGETLGIVGESGCGKTTLARLAMGLIHPSAGSVLFEGRDIRRMGGRDLRGLRRSMQMVFQDPFASLNPRMTIGRNIDEPLRIHRIADRAGRRRLVLEAMADVNLAAEYYERYPHEFSGGQRQRAVIARALVLAPRLIICDEPVSALDVSVQSQILNLLSELKASRGLAYIFIAHGLHVVRHISDRVAVMYLGQIVELSETDELFAAPRHPYTEALISAVAEPDPEAADAARPIVLRGDLPSPANPPSGCRFHTRCAYAQSLCRTQAPELAGDVHRTACHFPLR